MMTQDPANRVTPQAPAGYRREDFADVLTALESGQIDKVFDYPRRCIVTDLQTLPEIVLDDSDTELTGDGQYSSRTPPCVGRG